MLRNRLYLKKPTIEELDYHRKLLSDANTMNYNKGYGENGSGCYFSTKEETEKWYKDWLSVPNRYYAYIMTKHDNKPIGDVNIHYNSNYSTYMIGIVIEAKYRGQGYAAEALTLLADKAFYELELDEIADAFSSDRIAAEKAFKKVGFIRKSDDFIVLTKKDYEEIHKS